MNILRDPYLMTLINILLLFGVTLYFCIYRYFFQKRSLSLLVLLTIISLLPTLSLFRNGTFEAGDLRIHTAHLINFYHLLSQGYFLPSWAGELCGGHGCPVFEFTYLLPYYIGSFFHFFGFSYLLSIKLVLAFSYILSGLTMYYWAKDEFGRKAAFFASVAYLFAPFHLADIHFRGSVGEVLSFVFIPLLFLFTKKIIDEKTKLFQILLPLCVLLILLSHPSITFATVPLSFLYGVLVWRTKKNREMSTLLYLGGSYFFSILISAFYWLPPLLELGNTWYTPTPVQFTQFKDYLISPSGFGFLFQGHMAEIRPIIGYIQVMMVIVGIWYVVKKKVEKELKSRLIFFLVLFFLLFFMMLPITLPLWRNTPILKSFIMVWRLLVPIAFLTAAITGIIVKHIKQERLLSIICFALVASTVLNWTNRKMVPELTHPLLQENEFYSEYLEKGNQFSINRQITRQKKRAEIVINERSSTPLDVIQGEGTFVQTLRKQEFHQYVINAQNTVMIRENTFFFPGWNVTANGKDVPINFKNQRENSYGKITFSLKKGLYLIDVVYTDSPIRSVAKKISMLSLILGILYLLLPSLSFYFLRFLYPFHKKR